MVPVVGAHDLRRVRGVLERVVRPVGLAVRDGLHLAVDGDHRVAEAVELGLGGRGGGDADGAHAGAAAAVGDAEGFVQVEMADVGADVAGAAEADLGVHVGAVHVDLAAVAWTISQMSDLLEDAVGAGIGDHQGGEIDFFVLLRPWREVGHVDVALASSQATGTTFRIRRSTALAGLVPWALVGIRQTLRCPRRGSRGRRG
jgi:hypothetical protein